MSGLWLVAFVALWVLVLVEALLVLAVMRQLGLVYDRLPPTRTGLPPGTVAPDFTLPDLNGRPRSLKDYAGRMVILAFVSPGCSACKPLLPALNDLFSMDGQGDRAVLVACGGPPEDCRQLSADNDVLPPVLLGAESGMWDLYSVPGVPYAVSINEKGVIYAGAYVHGMAGLKRLCGIAAEAVPPDEIARGQDKRAPALPTV